MLERVSPCRLADKGQYQDFLKCLNLYAQDICSRHELSAAVQDVLGRYPELLVCQVLSLALLTAATVFRQLLHHLLAQAKRKLTYITGNTLASITGRMCLPLIHI